MKLNVIKVEPVTPEQTAEPSTMSISVTSNDSSSIRKSRASRNVEIDDSEETSFLIQEVVDAIESGVEWRNLGQRERKDEGKH